MAASSSRVSGPDCGQQGGCVHGAGVEVLKIVVVGVLHAHGPGEGDEGRARGVDHPVVGGKVAVVELDHLIGAGVEGVDVDDVAVVGEAAVDENVEEADHLLGVVVEVPAPQLYYLVAHHLEGVLELGVGRG